jgi:hypothetical protein
MKSPSAQKDFPDPEPPAFDDVGELPLLVTEVAGCRIEVGNLWAHHQAASSTIFSLDLAETGAPELERFLARVRRRVGDGPLMLRLGDDWRPLLDRDRPPEPSSPDEHLPGLCQLVEGVSRLKNPPERIVLLVETPYVAAALQSALTPRTQRLSNDLAVGEDLLGVEVELAALAEGLLLADVAPPLTVGILGGWGSGKSWALHLLEKRMAEIRSLPVPPGDFPYVGHPYLVRFDAWTYAKADLWASLMQTVFFEIDRQLTMEKTIREAGVEADEGGKIWQLLYDLEPARREAILDDPQASEVLAALAALGCERQGQEELWRTLTEIKREEAARLRVTEGQLDEARKRLAERRADLEQQVDETLDERARVRSWNSVSLALRTALGFREDDAPEPDQLRRELAGPGAAFKRWIRALGADWPSLVAGLAATGAVSWWGSSLSPDVPLWAPATLGSSAVLWGSWKGWKGRVEGLLDRYREVWDAEQTRLADSRPALRAQLLEQAAAAEGEVSVEALEAEVERLAAKAAKERRRVGLTAQANSLAELVSARLAGGEYESRLGLLHQVQRDLGELSRGLAGWREALAAAVGLSSAGADAGESPTTDQALSAEGDRVRREIFPRGPARVVLFIDDLDRCPPDTVVEVLEATQLLVKTSLFVVVLAMDVRYVTRALEKAYEGILDPEHGPTGLDYIEKIVQIPYQVRPAAEGSLDRFLAAQMAVRDDPEANGSGGPGDLESAGRESAGAPPLDEPLPSRTLEFTGEQLTHVRQAAERCGLTPRAIKRLVNVYKLLVILWTRPGGLPRPRPEQEELVVALLGVACRSPTLADEVLTQLEADLGPDDWCTERSEDQPLLDALRALVKDRSDGTPPAWLSTQARAIRAFSFPGH